jgi:hypothetical protein
MSEGIVSLFPPSGEAATVSAPSMPQPQSDALADALLLNVLNDLAGLKAAMSGQGKFNEAMSGCIVALQAALAAQAATIAELQRQLANTLH